MDLATKRLHMSSLATFRILYNPIQTLDDSNLDMDIILQCLIHL